MNIVTGERGVLIIDILLTVFAVLFILLTIVALLGHNVWAALVSFLIGCLLFPVGKPREEGGPPHGLDVAQLGDLLGKHFDLVEHEPVTHPIPEREHPEQWARFVRR